MFGYVTAYKPELKIKDYEAYKGVYCTLCKEMGKEYGLLSRLLLSYDGAFYVLYKLGVDNIETTAEKEVVLDKAYAIDLSKGKFTVQ
jgi:hypothetical protein